MELLMSFTDEVLTDDPPAHWVEITPQSSKVVEPEAMWEWSNRCQRAYPQGSFPMTGFPGCSKPLAIPLMATTSILTISNRRTGMPNIFTQWVKTPPGSPAAGKWMSPSRFTKIARSSWRDDAFCITTDLPQGLTTPSCLLAGIAMATMTSMQLWLDAMMSISYVDSVMTSMSLVSLGPTPMAVDCPMPTLGDTSEPED